jgi:presenilin-like A22 family membrane protease
VADTEVVHPNRDKAESKATRAAVMLLLITSGVLVLIVMLGGWSQLQGMHIVAAAYVFIYFLMAYFVSKWNRGVLPVAAGLAILLTVVAAVAGPAWFARDKEGFVDPALPPSILGLLTIILIPVSILLVAFALRGLQQQWNVEVEVPREDAERYRRGDYGGGEPSTA